VRNRYLASAGGEPFATEDCRLAFYVRPAGYLITWESTLTANKGELQFGDQEEMGLGVRLATLLAVVSGKGGRITDGEGRRGADAVWGRQAAWCDYSGPRDGQFIGALVMADPANPRPSWWHVRDYGLMVANAFGARSAAKDQPAKLVVKPGDSLRPRYGIYIHSGASEAALDPVAAYHDYVAVLKN
jgi:hypothetical protein